MALPYRGVIIKIAQTKCGHANGTNRILLPGSRATLPQVIRDVHVGCLCHKRRWWSLDDPTGYRPPHRNWRPTWRIVAAESILIETRIFFSHNLQSEPRARIDKLLCGNYRKHFTKNGMVYRIVPQKNIKKESKIKICFLDPQTASVSMRQNLIMALGTSHLWWPERTWVNCHPQAPSGANHYPAHTSGVFR